MASSAMVDLASVILICSLCLFDVIMGSKFILFDQKASWTEANLICQRYGHRLATIRSAREQEILETTQISTKGYVWIGLKGETGNNVYRWVDSSPLEYSHWAQGFPGYQEGLNCARVIPQDSTWESANCSLSLKFVCQTKVNHAYNVVTTETKIKGLLLGACLVGGFIALLCVTLQMTCCRIRPLDRLKKTFDDLGSDRTPII